MNSSVFSVRSAKVDLFQPNSMNLIFISIFSTESKSRCFSSFPFINCSVFSVRSAKVDVFHPLSS